MPTDPPTNAEGDESEDGAFDVLDEAVERLIEACVHDATCDQSDGAQSADGVDAAEAALIAAYDAYAASVRASTLEEAITAVEPYALKLQSYSDYGAIRNIPGPGGRQAYELACDMMSKLRALRDRVL